MKPLTFSILRLLGDGDFHSGVALARELGVSRASVSNALRRLDTAGLAVHAVHGRGYRLAEPVLWLERDAILGHLGPEAQGIDLEVLDSVASTNDLLLKEAGTNAPGKGNGIRVVVAEFQTQGRGRRGRSWHSGLGGSLTFSLAWRFQQGAGFLSGLSLVVGVAILRVLKSAGIGDVALKWPNDVMVSYCKLAGTLIELQGDMLGPTLAVIGVGINLKLSGSIRARIDQGAIDVYSITGETPDRNRLLAMLLLEIVAVLREFEQQGFAAFQDEWVDHHLCEGRSVVLGLHDGSTRQGVVQGVALDGSLGLRTTEGIRQYSSGEITLCRMT
ncbi:biotin--[acetyl-CoA-carboxylase] ligase [Nitrosovibrio sp. Nv17]|uniref:biotin--[acetyl-CoA-carboxylase] ligase n=1 Tax=Nitrosovibrio sp. Nv17 TaxID=1855339 RepID=UPI0015A69802|nr:biotin--[acetyl-CoA-carboxylase] ligase [Nitrosovibrio sp. Nv17]